ncbi:shikimate kinase [Geomonas paludis]|uniref:Shikimate kinase n=2 Tax=Geomonas paludis TaxID=2740185 RepID=A0A6V8MUN3_9BACT|nr:shikimate kinase [Geomonas paludis]GFO63895.1 shikimate kinase [Geomonas paludis]
MKNIFLTGFMGCGKTSVGQVLAQRLGWSFVDLDQVIVEQAGRSIKEIFAEEGEPFFRALESTTLERVATGAGQVVSTGGGVVIAPANRTVMRSHGCIVNLTATVETIAQRVSGDSERPLLADDASVLKIRTMLENREQFYADADVRIDTTGKDIAAVADEVLDFCKGSL